MKADSGTDMERAWCDNCGCGIWIRRPEDAERTYLKAGTFVFLYSVYLSKRVFSTGLGVCVCVFVFGYGVYMC